MDSNKLPHELPEAVVINILRFVPQQQRLTSCALVSRAWAAAATFVTRAIDNVLCTGSKSEQLQA